MKGYQRKKWACFLFLCCIVLIGYSAIPLPGNEIFPFYSWTMFSLVPAQESEYVVLITEFQGKPVRPPQEFQRAGDMVVNHASIVAYRDIQNMGLAYEANDSKLFQHYQSLFEQNYLLPQTHYELDKTTYDPLTRWRTGKSALTQLQEWIRHD